MFAVATVFLVALLSLLITRVATLALVLTGMSREAARFQARSALTGTGFTTTESESVVDHPARRRIVMTLMLVGGAGLVTTIAALIIGFTNTSTEQAWLRLGALLVALAAIVLVSRTERFNRAIAPLLSALVSRYTELEARDYARLLHLGGDWGVSEVAVESSDWLACERLEEIDLRAEGVVVLGIERREGRYFGAPDLSTRVEPGDALLLYGRGERLAGLDGRPGGEEGDRAHREAVAAEARLQDAERERDSQRPD